MGIFSAFLDDRDVALVGWRRREGLESGRHAASLGAGGPVCFTAA